MTKSLAHLSTITNPMIAACQAPAITRKTQSGRSEYPVDTPWVLNQTKNVSILRQMRSGRINGSLHFEITEVFSLFTIVFKILKSQQRRVRKESQFVVLDPGLQTGTD